MLSTADLDALTARAAAARAALVLVGDPAQIGAVNAAGGMFDHLTHTLAGQVVQLAELHRFTHTWEAAATLRLRDGDPACWPSTPPTTGSTPSPPPTRPPTPCCTAGRPPRPAGGTR